MENSSSGKSALKPSDAQGLGKRIKNTAKHSAVFGVGGFLQQGASLLLLPVYTQYLTVEDYGILNMILVAKPAISMLTSSMIGPALFRSYYDYDDPEQRGMVVSTTLLLSLILSFAMFAIGHALAPQLSVLLTGSSENSLLISLVVFTGALQSIQTVGMAVFRAKQESARFTILSVSGLIVTLLITIYLVTILRIGYAGVIYGALAGKLVISLAMLHLICTDLKVVFSLTEARKIIAYGHPYISLNLFTLAEKSFVRIVLQTISGPAAVGLFALATRFAQVIQTLIIAPMKLIRPSAVFEAEKDPRASEFYSKLVTYYLLFSTFVASLIIGLSGDVLSLIANESYLGALKVIPFTCIAVLLLGLQGYMSIGLMLKRKTGWFPLCTGLGLGLTLALEVLLTPAMGASGAAISLAAGYGLSSFLRFRISRDVHPIYFEPRLFKIFVSSVAVLGLALIVPGSPSVFTLAARLLIIVIGMPATLFIMKFFEDIEIKQTRELVASRLRKRI